MSAISGSSSTSAAATMTRCSRAALVLMLLLASGLLTSPASSHKTSAASASASEGDCAATTNDGGNLCPNKTADKPSVSVDGDDQNGHGGTCSLYLAPSSLPNAGLGIYTAVDVPLGSHIGGGVGGGGDGDNDGRSTTTTTAILDDLFVPILDKYKTLPYRGQQRFLSWLGYVWPTQADEFWHTTRDSFPKIHESHYRIDEGLNGAGEDGGLTFSVVGNHGNESSTRVSAFAPGIASQVNSHPRFANIDKDDGSGLGSKEEDRGNTNNGLGDDTRVKPQRGVTFSATQDIAAGSELFLNYGREWHRRYDVKYRRDKKGGAANGDGGGGNDEPGGDAYYKAFDTLEDYKRMKGRIPDTLPTEADKRRKQGVMMNKIARRREKEEKVRAEAAEREAEKLLAEELERKRGAKKPKKKERRDGKATKAATATTTTTTTVTETTTTTTNATHVETTTIQTETTTTRTLKALRPHRQVYDTGTPVYTKFKKGGWYDGQITGFDTNSGMYEVTYSDGEKVDYDDIDRVRKMVTTNMDKKRKKLLKKQRKEKEEQEEKEEKRRRRKLEKQRKEEEEQRKKLEKEWERIREEEEMAPPPIESVKEVDWLEEHGLCIDNIRAGQSTVDEAGMGAFANNFLSKGSLIAPAPLLALKREDLVMYEADVTQNTFRSVLNFDKDVGQELLLNYCYGHPDSDLLLLPYSPVVNFINHDGGTPNAEIRWPDTADAAGGGGKLTSLGLFRDPKEWLDLHPLDVLDQSGKLMMSFVALRDITPGEEIFINYGPAWEGAWEKHVVNNDRRAETESNGLAHAFRHEIGVPDGFFPDAWKHQPAVYELAPLESPLKPGELVQLKWAHNGRPIAESAWRVGLPSGFSAHMLEFSRDRGIADLYKQLIYEPHLHEPYLNSNDWNVFDTHGEQWFAHRFKSTAWNFNMHYVAAWDEAARVSFLRAMGGAGFDVALKSIGTTFGLDNITCFHASFMGLSECDNSFTHADVYATGEKGFNIIYPIITVNGTKPELDIISDDANVVLAVNYEYDVAYVLGDWGYHKTSAIDYAETGQLRIVAGAYCAQIEESNEKMIKYLYDGEDPAPFMDQFNLKETHWGNGHSLPK